MIYGTFLNKETLLSLESFLDIFAQPWDEESTQSEGTVKYWTTDPYRAGPSSNYFAIWRNKRCQLDSLSRPELQMKTNLLKSTAPCQMQICASRSLSNAKSLTNRGQTRHYQSPGVSSETMNTGFSRSTLATAAYDSVGRCAAIIDRWTVPTIMVLLTTPRCSGVLLFPVFHFKYWSRQGSRLSIKRPSRQEVNH